MDISRFFDDLVYFLKDNPLFAIIGAVILAAFIFARPKTVVKFALLFVLLAGVIYMIYTLAAIGTERKRKVLEKPFKSWNHFPGEAPVLGISTGRRAGQGETR